MPYLLEMCPSELAAAREKGLPLLIPTGSVELHGGQLPFGTDLFITEGVVREIERRLPVVVGPSITVCPTGWAVSGPGEGTMDIGVDCFIESCEQLLRNYERMGLPKIYVLVHHQAANISTFIKTAVLKYSMYEASQTAGEGWWTKGSPSPHRPVVEVAAATLDTGFFPGHGGRGETEAMLAYRPECVRMEQLEAEPYHWNATAREADPQNAEAQKQRLTALWVEKIRRAD